MRTTGADKNVAVQDGRERMALKLLGAILAVACVVAVAHLGRSSEMNAKMERTQLISKKLGAKRMRADLEREVFEMTGIRAEVVDVRGELVKRGRKKMDENGVQVVSDTEFGPFYIKGNNGANRYLSYVNGVSGSGKNMKTRTSKNDVCKWEFDYQAQSGLDYGYIDIQATHGNEVGACVRLASNNDVEVTTQCAGSSQIVLMRVSSGENPTGHYTASLGYIFYGLTNRRFLTIDSSGDGTHARQDPRDGGVFYVESA